MEAGVSNSLGGGGGGECGFESNVGWTQNHIASSQAGPEKLTIEWLAVGVTLLSPLKYFRPRMSFYKVPLD